MSASRVRALEYSRVEHELEIVDLEYRVKFPTPADDDSDQTYYRRNVEIMRLQIAYIDDELEKLRQANSGPRPFWAPA